MLRPGSSDAETMKSKIRLLLALSLIGGLCGCCTKSSNSFRTQEWGPSVNGLQISLSVLTQDNLANPVFEVTFRNSGMEDRIVKLGSMFENGKWLEPENLHLTLVGADGKNQDFEFAGRRFSGVQGRIDDYIVPLRAGACYSLKLRGDEFWLPATVQIGLTLTSSRNELQAWFLSDGIGTRPDARLMNLWKGKLRSNRVLLLHD